MRRPELQLCLVLLALLAGCASHSSTLAAIAPRPSAPTAAPEPSAPRRSERATPSLLAPSRNDEDPFGSPRGRVGPYRYGDLSILLGVRAMRDDAAWGPVRDQLAGGLVWSYEPKGSWVGFDTAFFYSADSADLLTAPNTTARVRGETYEFSMGAIKSFFLGGSGLRTYVGAGGSLLSTRLGRVENGFVLEGNDNSFGVYGRAGLVYHIGYGGYLGVDYRYLGATSADILGLSFDSDYDQLTFNFGTSF